MNARQLQWLHRAFNRTPVCSIAHWVEHFWYHEESVRYTCGTRISPSSSCPSPNVPNSFEPNVYTLDTIVRIRISSRRLQQHIDTVLTGSVGTALMQYDDRSYTSCCTDTTVVMVRVHANTAKNEVMFQKCVDSSIIWGRCRARSGVFNFNPH